MHNQIAPQAAASLDMILGAGGRTSPKKTSATGEFNQFFRLPPQVTSAETNALPGMNPDNSRSFGMETLGQTMLILPRDMALYLGIGTENYPEFISAQAVPGQPEKLLAINAEILSTGESEDQTLYLRLAPGKDNENLVSMIPEQAGQTEKLIPIRLRTVGQQKGRLVADAELLTATGQEMPVRFKLELAGKFNGLQQLLTSPKAGETESGQNSPAKDIDLTRLLGELGVTRMVIENNESTLKAAMPITTTGKAALPVASMIPGQKQNGSNAQSSPSVSSVALDGMISTTSEKVQFNPENLGNGSEDLTDNSGLTRQGVGNDFLSLQSKAGVAEVVSALDGKIDTTLESSSRSSADSAASVKYFDLDSRLNQLKRSPGQTIRVQLIPAQLGKMDLSISVHRGTVTVSLMLDSMASKNAVEKNLSHLESRLAAAGIRVDNFQISVNQPSKGEAFAGYYQHHAFGQSQDRGSQRRSAYRQHHLRQFHAGDASFDKVMVNCLA